MVAKGGGVEGQRNGSAGWGLQRVCATFPATNTELRRDVGRDALASHGVNPKLVGRDGSATRAIYRQLLRIAIAPTGKIVARKLTAKLDREITIGFD